MNKLKDFVSNHKFLSTLLVLDLISFILGNIFIYSTTPFFMFLLFMSATSTYLIVLFEKHTLKIFIIGIALLIIGFIGGMFPQSIIALSVLLLPFVIFILPQSFLLLILKHFAIFEKQNIIVKTIIIDALIFIPVLIIFGPLFIPSI